MESAKEAFITEVNSFSSIQLSSSAGANEWTVLQVVEHLLQSEGGTLAYLKKKTQSGWEGLELANSTSQSNGAALLDRLHSTNRYSAPAILPEPLGLKTWANYQEEWTECRTSFYRFLNELEPSFYDRLVFRQPVAGPLDIFDTLGFLSAHIRHHLPQLTRIRQALSA
jgi:hypothetical protein